jgi:Uma2 family endonuclease
MTLAIAKSAEPRSRRWTREEFYRMAAGGYFQGQRVLLLEGEIFQMPPQGHAHAKAIWKCQTAMTTIYGADHWVRVQMPLNVSAASEPEPDIAVTKEPADAYRDHPTTALLVIEVSDTSLELDYRKASSYAGAEIPEYWILNLPRQTLEVYRNPDSAAKEYRKTFELARDKTISPIDRPEAVLSVNDLLS